MKNNNKQINLNVPIMSLLILIIAIATYAGVQSNNVTLTIVSALGIVFTIVAICMLEGININIHNIRNIKSNKRIISTIVISIISVLAVTILSCILYQYHKQYSQTEIPTQQQCQHTQYQQHNDYIVSINLDTNSNLLKITAIDNNTFADDTQDIYYNIPIELLKFPNNINYHYYYEPNNVLLHLADGKLTIDNLNNNNSNTTTESDILNISNIEIYEMRNEQLESNCNNNAYCH